MKKTGNKEKEAGEGKRIHKITQMKKRAQEAIRYRRSMTKRMEQMEERNERVMNYRIAGRGD